MRLRRAAIVSPIRTAIGKFGGGLSALDAGSLASIALSELITRSGVDPEYVDDCILGQGYANGEAPAIGRWAWLAAGLPDTVPGAQVDRRCGSGLQAIVDAAMMVQTGVADVVVAGGVESMSQVEHYSVAIRNGKRLGNLELHDRLMRARVMAQPPARFGAINGMIETAENLASDFGLTRKQCDAFASRSHQLATKAWADGKFSDEIFPVSVPLRNGSSVIVDRDEGPRADVTLESLSQLKPVAGGVVTAGSASQQNDAAAVCLVVAEDRLEELNLVPSGWLVGWAVTGCDPTRMGLGPVRAVSKLFSKTGLGWDDMDLIELNEAFAPQVLAVLKQWGWGVQDSRMEKLNTQGSGISLGHPVGATGARIMTSLLHALRRNGLRYGLETMCIGGGQGMAAIFEKA